MTVFHRKRFLWLLCGLLLAWSTGEAFPVEVHTSLRQVNRLDYDSGILLGASTGGAFYYFVETDSFFLVNVADGLAENDLSAVVRTSDGFLWLLGSRGNVDLFSASGDVHLSRFTEFADDPAIFRILDTVIKDDGLLVATDIGFTSMRYNPALNYVEVDYTVRRAGDLGFELPVERIGVLDGAIIVATEAGVGIQQPQWGAPADPGSWRTFSPYSADVPLRSLVTGEGTAWLLAGDDVFAITPDTLTFYLEFPGALDLAWTGGELLLATSGKIYALRDGEAVEMADCADFQGFARGGSGEWYYAHAALDSPGGLCRVDDGFHLVPPGPAGGAVAALDWGPDGSLWAVGAQEGAIGAGFYNWDGISWHNHTRQEEAYAQMNDLAYPVSLLVDRAGWCWMTTWGYGLQLYRPDTDEILHFDSNSPPGQRVLVIVPSILTGS